MKSIFRIILPCLLIFINACNRTDCCSIPDDRELAIKVIDQFGNDLLDSYSQERITIYYDEDGSLIKPLGVYKNRSTNHYINKTEDGGNILIIWANYEKTISQPITYILWNRDDMDTIACEFISNHGRKLISKVWYNGLKQEFEDDLFNGVTHLLTITKKTD